MSNRRNVIKLMAALPILGALAPGCTAKPADVAEAAEGLGSCPSPDPCEGCQGAFERDAATLTAHTNMAPPDEAGAPLELRGTVFAPDGTTPAGGIVLYFYHTDAEGLYSRGSNESEWSRRHGLLRGWVKTGDDGRYHVTTIKPGPYPNLGAPAHIHPTVLQEGCAPYWIDDIVFDGEFGVTDSYRAQRENRGGNGIVKLEKKKGVWNATRDIILERHPIRK